jgi:hypothetical protein
MHFDTPGSSSATYKVHSYGSLPVVLLLLLLSQAAVEPVACHHVPLPSYEVCFT